MSNPTLAAPRVRRLALEHPTGTALTRRGVLHAFGTFGVFVLAGVVVGWHFGVVGTDSGAVNTTTLVVVLSAFVVAVLITRRPTLAKRLGVVYAILEGVAVGVFAGAANVSDPGVSVEAVGVTLGVVLVVAGLYGTGLVKVTSRVRGVILFATLGAVAFYVVSLALSLLGGTNYDALGGFWGVVISLVLAAVAASTFLVDFDTIDRLIASGADADYAWYCAFSLVVSFLWLYLEIVNLLFKASYGARR